jgi:hypothetical protein
MPVRLGPFYVAHPIRSVLDSTHLRELCFETVQVLFVRFNGECLHLSATLSRLEAHSRGESGLPGFLAKIMVI